MWRYLLETKTLQIETFSVVFAVACVVGFLGLRARMRRLSVEPLPGAVYFFTTLTVILAGGHFYWLLFNTSYDAWSAISFLEPGRVFYGGFFAGILWSVFYTWACNIHISKFLSCASVPLSLSYAVGRIGCLANGCCWGTEANVPWGIRYPAGDFGAYAQQVASGKITVLAPYSIPVHPTPIYAAAGGLFLFFILDRLFERRHSSILIIGVYLFGEGGLRLLLEFSRDDTSRYYTTGLTNAQTVAGLLCFMGASLLLYVLVQGGVAWLAKTDLHSGDLVLALR